MVRTRLAGKAAVFDVQVKEVRRGADAEVDDTLATKLGLDSLDRLKDAARSQLVNEYANASRAHLKRALLDALDERHSFNLPSGMVEAAAMHLDVKRSALEAVDAGFDGDQAHDWRVRVSGFWCWACS